MNEKEHAVCRANLQAYNLLASVSKSKSVEMDMTEEAAYGKIYQKMASLIGGFNNRHTIDIACGTARHLKWLCRDCRDVVGLDISVGMLKLCRRKLQGKDCRNIDYVVADALHLPFRNDAFDVATTIESAHHFPNIGKGITEMTRVAHKIAFCEPNKESCFHRILQKLRSKYMRSVRFTDEHPYSLVEYYARGFSQSEIAKFLQKLKVSVKIVPLALTSVEISIRLLRVSRLFVYVLATIENILEKSPIIKNQLGDILVVGEKANML